MPSAASYLRTYSLTHLLTYSLTASSAANNHVFLVVSSVPGIIFNNN